MRKSTVSALRNLLIGVCCFGLSGCGTMYSNPKANESTGKYSSLDFNHSDIKTYQPYAGIESISFVYLRTYSDFRPDEFTTYVKEALNQIGFKRVYTNQELAQHIVATGLADKVGNLNDALGLNRLSKLTGPFLVADVAIHNTGGAWFESVVVFTDPSKPQTVLKASRHRLNWADYDAEIAGPVLNLMKQYYEDSRKLPVAPQQPKPAPGTDT